MTRTEALRHLARCFARRGYFRSERAAGARTHRGYECRFSAGSAAERDAIVALLRNAEIKPGKPFAKGKQWRIPVYGKDAVALLRDHAKRSS